MNNLTLEQKRQLAKELLNKRSEQDRAFPLSSAQARLWVHFRAYPESPAYVVPNLLELPQNIDLSILRKSITHVLELHDILNGVFEERDGKAYQSVERGGCESSFKVILIENIANEKLMDLVREEIQKPFDLCAEHPIRVVVFSDAHHTSYLLLMAHHIVCDGSSVGILCRQIIETYSNIQKYGSPADIPRPKQYREYLDLTEAKKANTLLEKPLSYWKNRIPGAETLDLPLLKKRPSLFSFRGTRKIVRVSENLTNKVTAASRTQGVTCFMYLMAAYRILLWRYSNQKDFCIGVPVNGRNKPGYENTLGMFVNTLPLRSEIIPEECFSDYLKRCKQEYIADLNYGGVHFEDIIKTLNEPADYSRTPVFQTIFQFFQDNIFQEGSSSDWREIDLEEAWISAKVDLAVFIKDRGTRWDLVMEYSTDLFDEDYVTAFAEHYIEVLEVIASTPDIGIREIDILTKEDKSRLFIEFNRPLPPEDPAECVHQWFERIVRDNPDAIAVVNCPDASSKANAETLTYAELNDKADRLAGLLQREYGAGPDKLVALCLEPSLEMIIGIMGILKSGAGYLPINPDYPVDRIDFMLKDAGVEILISMGSAPHDLNYSGSVLNIGDPQCFSVPTEQKVTTETHTGKNLAYCIYTSGSTGKPKGVLVEHRNVVRLFTECQHWFNFDQNDVWTLFHYFGFDFSVWEIFGALLFGGQLVIVPYQTTRTPGDFYRLLRERKVTVLSQTPSAFRLLIAEDARQKEPMEDLALRYVVFGGEALSYESLRPWIERYGDKLPRLINMYGITETTVHVTYREVRKADLHDDTGSDVGVPIPDLNVYILNEFMKPQPIGVPGEICVLGRGLARGYLNRDELTAAKFIDNPFCTGDRMYRSGDLARWLPNGNIEYLGRIDNQIKISGFRIELGEIEHVIRTQRGVSDCLVTVYEDAQRSRSLCAYIAGDESLTVAAIRTRIAQSLPDYMIPSHIIMLEAFPLNVNGKVDRKRLPDPIEVSGEEDEYVAPTTETEKRLVRIWQGILGIEKIGIRDSFTRLGGNSIKAVELMSKIRSEFGAEISIVELFRNNTVTAIAQFIEAGQVAAEIRICDGDAAMRDYMEEI